MAVPRDQVILAMRIDNKGFLSSELARVSAGAKCWIPRGHKAPIPVSWCCGPNWLVSKEGVPLAEDSTGVSEGPEVSAGRREGGGCTTVSSIHHATLEAS